MKISQMNKKFTKNIRENEKQMLQELEYKNLVSQFSSQNTRKIFFK